MSERPAQTADRVHVRIERLVLDGVPGFDHPADRRRLEAAVTSALAARLRERPIGAPTWAHREREGGGSVRIGTGVTAEQLGRQVAGAVHRGLAR
jgi:hypothetical protein